MAKEEKEETDFWRLQTDEDIELLRKRNEQRIAEAKKKLGRSWLCHPANHIGKKPKSMVLDPFRTPLLVADH